MLSQKIGRYALYQTQNMYNFILLDQIDGGTSYILIFLLAEIRANSLIDQKSACAKSNERTKISELSTNLSTAVTEARMDRSVETLLCELLGVRNLEDVSASSIDNNIYQPYADSIADISEANGWDTEISICEKEISKWNILRLPQLIERVNDLGSDVTEKLNEYAEHIPHYAVHDNSNEHAYHAEEESADTYEVEVETPSMVKNLKTSPWGYGACALIHLLILFNYLVTKRSNKIRNRKTNETAMQSGRMLNIDNN